MPELDSFQTPMLKQYAEIKAQYTDAILFFRLGDFYEMFLDDAKIASQILGITLTSRNKGKDGKIPMCGVPYHAAEPYIQKLVSAGHKVAICEQITEPTSGKDIVERDVIRVVTPSTSLPDLDSDSAGSNASDYLMTFFIQKQTLGYSLISVKSGEVLVFSERLADSSLDAILSRLEERIIQYQPAELLVIPMVYDQPYAVRRLFSTGVNPFRHDPEVDTAKNAIEVITHHYRVTSLEGFGIEGKDAINIALANALIYLTRTQKNEVSFLKPPKLVQVNDVLSLNGQTIRNLELLSTVRDGDTKGSLFAVLNNTSSPMGSRLLKQWMLQPLANAEAIAARHEVIEWLLADSTLRSEVSSVLSNISDMERSLSRLSLGIGNARDLVNLKINLQAAQLLAANLGGSVPSLIASRIANIDWSSVDSLVELLHEAILEEPAVSVREGRMIAPGYSEELDNLRSIANGGKQWLKDLEGSEQQKTGINSLKIGFNKVFGYYIEVSKANIDKVPEYYIRRQTLTNAERYIIPELKEHEDTVLDAESKLVELEYRIFLEVTRKVVDQTVTVQKVAELIAVIDVLAGLSELALANNFVRPKIVSESVLEITGGRHVVVEQMMNSQASSGSFVPNDTMLTDDNRMMILTGANMAGKSTYIRQVAILVIMAQMGSFVPAEQMRFGLIDQIHTRIGAMDSLASGLSTFMVEMIETASILNNVTDRSLVVLDEIGRGTSTYDGLAIAWAVSEYLLNTSKAKVLFATHYHELTELSTVYDHVNNYHLSVSEQEDEVIFLYRVTEGKASQSYGIEVAKRAGLPTKVTRRALEVLGNLTAQQRAISPLKGKQLGLFGDD